MRLGRGADLRDPHSLAHCPRLETCGRTTSHDPLLSQQGVGPNVRRESCKAPDQRCVVCPITAECGDRASAHVPKMFPFDCAAEESLARLDEFALMRMGGWRRWDSNPRPPACKYARPGQRRTTTRQQHDPDACGRVRTAAGVAELLPRHVPQRVLSGRKCPLDSTSTAPVSR